MITRATGHLKRAGMDGAIVGLDYIVCLGFARELGYDAEAITELLPAIEGGMMTAIAASAS